MKKPNWFEHEDRHGIKDGSRTSELWFRGRTFQLQVHNNGHYEWSVRVDSERFPREGVYCPNLEVSGKCEKLTDAVKQCEEAARRLATISSVFEF